MSLEKIINDAWENKEKINQNSDQKLKDAINQVIADLDSGKSRVAEKINEEWITDKTRFFWDGLNNQRIDRPYKRVDGILKPTSWKNALELAKEKISNSKSEKISALSGDLVDIETVYALKKLMKNSQI